MSSGLWEAEQVFKDRIRAHPFIVSCRAGTMRIETLRHFLAQHAKYSGHFTRYLTALMSNLQTQGDCMALAENLLEEFGLDESGSVSHAELYRTMLRNLGVDAEAEKTLPETQNLIDMMYMQCRHTDHARGLGALCLGAEAIVPELYSGILDGFMKAGVSPDHLMFFSLHIGCDDRHAETMRQIMCRLAETDNARSIAMISAGEAVVNARLRLLDALEAR
ncbi:TenA family transcriptional regulator [Paraburkholderia diazotrophica]|nr:iron-containing redox enzyme family protein [Paraburkholderia diazotrophica]